MWVQRVGRGETGNAYNTNLKVNQVALLRYLRMPQLVVFPSVVVVGVYANSRLRRVCWGSAKSRYEYVRAIYTNAGEYI